MAQRVRHSPSSAVARQIALQVMRMVAMPDIHVFCYGLDGSGLVAVEVDEAVTVERSLGAGLSPTDVVGVVVDLGDVPRLDTCGLTVVMWVFQHACRLQAKFVLASPSTRVLRDL